MDDKIKNTIYAVEDDEGIQELYQGALEENYFIRIFPDAQSFLRAFEDKKPDLVLLDIMLPDMDGYSVLVRIRETDDRIPVIVVSAKSDELSLVKGLNKGADDYITKPFSMPVVMKHIEAVLRRAEQGGAAPNTVIRYKEITVDTDSLTVLVGTESVSLTTREFEILKLLLENQGRVVSRERLLDTVWGYDYVGDEKIINTHIKNIRKKLGVDYIETMRGAGYKIEKED